MANVDKLSAWYSSLENELKNSILPFWMKYAPDHVNGGYVGEISGNLEICHNADKGIIMNSRLLYTFSLAYNFFGDDVYLAFAKKVYKYISEYFLDPIYGGCYWMLDRHGKPVDEKKQIYAHAFLIYSIAEYYQASEDSDALLKAIDIFMAIEKHAFDLEENGYLEALTRKWEKPDDYRLSEKDMNAEKSMNTHLHILEAYTKLYSVWKDVELEKKLRNLIELHLEKIANQDSLHLQLFFDKKWNSLSEIISFGHDIEASWLLREAAAALGNDRLLSRVEEYALAVAAKSLQYALARDGSMYNEASGLNGEVDKERIWWVQAEAMNGFMYAWEISANNDFLDAAIGLWDFILKHLKHPSGEWWWSVDDNYLPNRNEVLAGNWKAPYHNSRACIELMKIIEKNNLNPENCC